MRAVAWLSCLVLLPLSPLCAQDRVPLGYAVPPDVHFYVHGMTSQHPDPGWVRFENACRQLADSGIHEDLLDLITWEMSARQREEVKGTFDHVMAVLGQVDWGLLAGREMVFTYKMAIPMPEYLAVFRVPGDRIADQRAGVKAMLTDLAAMAGLPDDAVQEVERRSGDMIRFAIDLDQAQLEVVAGAVGDVLVMSTSSRMANAAMRRLQSGDGSRSLVDSERFKASLQRLPEPTEAVLYVDLHGLFDYVANTMQLAKAGIRGSGERADWSREVVDLIDAGFRLFDVVDHVLVSEASDGTTVTSTSLVQLAPDFADTGLAATVREQKSWDGWFERVPADATGFAFDKGVDLAALLDLLVGRAREVSGSVDAMLAGEAAGTLAAIRQALSHLSGESCWVSFPTAGPEGCAAGESVCYLRLQKPEQLAELLPEWLHGCQQFLASRGQHLDVEIRDGLHEIRMQAFPWIRPVVGVRGDELIVATSPAALEKIGRVQRGLEPGIRENGRFAALGVGGADTVEYLMYGQVETGMGAFANLVSAAGFVMALLPEDRDTKPLIKVGALLTKLAPALRELDMRYDWGTEMLPSDDPNAFLSRTVYRYRDRSN